ncbi:MAG: hypothetical protein ABSF33_03470 [Acidimicrobiales bacterium]|jgi:hypothetical protein
MAEDEQENQSPPSGPPEDPSPVPALPPRYEQFAAGGAGAPPSLPPIDRMTMAWQRRTESDYIFDYWTALGWTVLTLGIYGLYVFYQLVRRMRDHNVRRVEFLDASLAFAWDEAGRRGVQEELTPSFQRASAHMDVLRRMTGDFREPVIWLVLAIVARGLVEIIAFVLLDQDLVKHDRAEIGVEYELSVIFERFGQAVPAPDQGRAKGQDNYVGRIIATIVTFGIYLFWWYYDQMIDPNRHFQTNWAQEDALVAAANALR